MEGKSENLPIEPCGGEVSVQNTDLSPTVIDDQRSEYRRLYSHDPLFLICSPGRVNIIGEHVDYCGYSVLPMAISKMIRVAVGVGEGDSGHPLEIRNAEEKNFAMVKFEKKSEIEMWGDRGAWYNYVVAGYRVGRRCVKGEIPPMRMLVSGDLPRAAGLSSSSAVVVASALSVIAACGESEDVTRQRIAELCVEEERGVGLAGGAMDQNAILLCTEGSAMRMWFDPPSIALVPLPPEVRFVVANSLVHSAKAATAHRQYNMRVFECKICAFLLLKNGEAKCGVPSADDMSSLTLRGAQCRLDLTVQDCLALMDDKIPKDALSKEFVRGEIGDDRIAALTKIVGEDVWNKNELFYPYRRGRHVFEESLRVEQFEEIARDIHNATDRSMLLHKLGNLMNASDHSLVELYDCGCQELTRLTKLARDCGALGSRITGAGWGGCTVSMVLSDHLDVFLQGMKDFYQGVKVEQPLSCYLFPVVPSEAARIFSFASGSFLPRSS